MSEREDSLSHIAAQVNKHRRRGVTGCSCGSWFALNGRPVDEQHAEHVAKFVLKHTASIVKAAYAEVADHHDQVLDNCRCGQKLNERNLEMGLLLEWLSGFCFGLLIGRVWMRRQILRAKQQGIAKVR